MLAAPSSGSGKTTAAALLCLALRARGLSVQPFKLGPDYLDPTHLSRAAGRPARNLDSFLLPPERVGVLFARAANAAHVSVVEGVMGLYDGRDPTSDEHSGADLARQLGLRVVLLIDAGGMARTVAALAAGLRDFGTGVDVAGVILNRVGSEGHAQLCEVALAEVGLPLLGFIPADPALHLPERHLGLLAASEAGWDEAAALHAARFLRLDALLAATRLPALEAMEPLQFPTASARIAYAWDEAFSFYYPDALDELRLAGAELLPFSPLRDVALPPGVGGLLLGGGYPELYAAQLSTNVSMRRAVRDFAAAGRPVIGECGGLMYLGETLEDLEGRTHAMCSVIPARTRMQPRLSLGYREARALAASPLAPAGAQLRGHEFHYSERLDLPTHPAYRWTGHAGEVVEEGHAQGNVLASYLHLHYGADPALARRVVNACRS
ncbi:Cobyrinic acid A,C-diamide synthase (plasmid) [Deinococcus proteolyticus MRP]|uniref:Cobyrinate a,c-diamide synthase n=1 Tax=Deinococcus proteolyticus (strain ATCC 35074 / DSM 20540 / JCM 6276 / NBRC 101906 / NCIMB 13154 / VKM Ac-1939 / CCM 2703 / MRP) TaxID=693977 RepID=F0RR08_DEIPM|nr:Cobyrinic acid A,C-diamide synthase [Deinococcus proteolyticus MRP]